MPIPKLTLVTLGVKDFKKSVKFYQKGLGWKKSSASVGDVAFFALEGIVLGIYPRKLLAQDAKVPAAGSGFSGISLAVNTANDAQVDEFLLRAKKAGAKIVKKAGKVFWGGYSGYFSDPDGHLWEVAHNPFWKLDRKGSLILP
jgi:uncharacterized glyoxalase superfamily protein PhnB